MSRTHGGHIEAWSHLSVIRQGKVLSMNLNTGTTTICVTSQSGRALVAVAKRPAIKPDGEATPQLRHRLAPVLAQLSQPARGVGQI